MAEHTKIEWADHTFNSHIGCTKVTRGPQPSACDHCYAERFGKRIGVEWGAGKARRRTSEANWKKPLAWDRRAAVAGKPVRVFTGSLCDWADGEIPASWRDDLWRLIGATPHLIWMPLTKRPKIAADLLATPDYLEALGLDYGAVMSRIWVGMTAEHQPALETGIKHLLRIPAAVRFLSCEPLLGLLDVRPYLNRWKQVGIDRYPLGNGPPEPVQAPALSINWIIAGGESGPKARPSHPDWFRSLRDQATDAGVPFHFKQWGEWCYSLGRPFDVPDMKRHIWIGNDGSTLLPNERSYRQMTREDDRGDPHARKLMLRVGKQHAGRLLDGRTWDELPT